LHPFLLTFCFIKLKIFHIVLQNIILDYTHKGVDTTKDYFCCLWKTMTCVHLKYSGKVLMSDTFGEV